MWSCYIKPTRYIHSSGYRCFEVGYCYGKSKTKKVIPLGKCSDAIHLYDLEQVYRDVHMDLTRNGYIRLWSNHKPFHWPQQICSDAYIVDGPIDEEWCEKEWQKLQKGKNADF